MDSALRKKGVEKEWIIMLQDIVLSLLASLLSILIVRWLSDPIPGFTLLVAKWLGVSLIGTIAGVYISKSYKDVRRYATVRSIAKAVVSIFIKAVVVILALSFRLIILPPPSTYAVIAVLCDLILSGIFILNIRVYARLFNKEDIRIEDKAARKTALVVGTSLASVHLAAELDGKGYDVLGLITRALVLPIPLGKISARAGTSSSKRASRM